MTASPEQQDQLWWEWTRSRGRTAFLRQHVAVDGLGQGAFVYLLTRGLLSLFGGSMSPDPLAGALGATFFLSVYVLWSYFGGIRKWDRYTQKYQSSSTLSPPPPNHALQRTGIGGTASSDQHA